MRPVEARPYPSQGICTGVWETWQSSISRWKWKTVGDCRTRWTLVTWLKHGNRNFADVLLSIMENWSTSWCAQCHLLSADVSRVASKSSLWNCYSCDNVTILFGTAERAPPLLRIYRAGQTDIFGWQPALPKFGPPNLEVRRRYFSSFLLGFTTAQKF